MPSLRPFLRKKLGKKEQLNFLVTSQGNLIEGSLSE